MKRIFIILCLMMICNISYANIASTGYVDSVIATKQDKLPNVPGNNGKYKLVYNSNTGQIGWEFEQFSLTCSSGTYDIGFSQCIGPSINGSSYTLDNIRHTWDVTFNYGNVKGITSCNDIPGSWAIATNENFSQTDTGPYCWCKMTEPTTSGWLIRHNYDIVADCVNDCANRCMDLVMNSSEYRSAMFGSVGN